MIFFFLMQNVWKYIDDLAGRGIEWYYIVELLFYWSAGVFPIALPLSILLSSITTMGSFGEHYELAAMKSSGISLYRIMRPLIFLVIFFAAGAFAFYNYVIPVANLKSENLVINISKQKPALNLQQGIFYSGLDGYSIKVGKKTGENSNELHDVLIYDHLNGDGNTKVTVAKSGLMEITPDERYMILSLFEGNTYEDAKTEKREDRDRKPFIKASFDEAVIRFDLAQFSSGNLRENTSHNFYMMNVVQLMETADSLHANQKEIKQTFATNFETKYYFAQIKLDSAQPERIKDDIISDFNPVLKDRAVENALRMARSNVEYLHAKILEYEWIEKLEKRHYIEWHKKFALSAACLVLFFVGAPLGAIIRKGGIGMPVVLSFIVFIIYHIANTIFEKSARDLVLEPWAGVWIGTLLLLPFGIALTISAARDSNLLSLDFYSRISYFFKNLKLKKAPKTSTEA